MANEWIKDAFDISAGGVRDGGGAAAKIGDTLTSIMQNPMVPFLILFVIFALVMLKEHDKFVKGGKT
jgi:hypothetical protein